MDKSTEFTQNRLSDITTYQAGIVQASAHRVVNRVVSDYLLQYGLTAMQWFIIGCVYDSGESGIRQSDLTRRAHTTLPYITTTLALLESKKIIDKISHTGDSRVKLVSINAEYWPTVQKIEDGLRDHMRRTLYAKDNITSQELTDYISVLYKIVNNS